MPVPPDLWPRAVARLLGASGPSDTAVTRFLTNARAECTDLSHLWMIPGREGSVVEAAMALPGSGRTAMIFVSPPTPGEGPQGDDESVAQRSRVVRAVIESARGSPGGRGRGTLNLAQALVEPEQVATLRALRQAGLSDLASLAYLRRPLPVRRRDVHVEWPTGMRLIEVSRLPRHEIRPTLIRTMEASYEGTLDCAALCGLRDVSDVLDSHLGVGEHDPSLWWVLFDGAAPIGAALFSPSPEQETVELVYLGLAPGARGRGLARRLLDMGIARLGGRRERTLACAVDLANAPALSLYEAAKFKQFAVRAALIMPLTTRRP